MKQIQQIFLTRDFKIFLITMFSFGIASGLFTGVINNFLAEILHINRFERGIVEFLRELPGLSLILLLSLMYRLSETKILRIAFFIAFIGVVGIFISGPNRIFSVIFLLFWSTGEHLIMPVRHSYAIHSAQKGKEGRAIGVVGSFEEIGKVSGFYLVPFIFFLISKIFPTELDISIIPFKVVFVISGIFLLLAIFLSTGFYKSEHQIKKERLYVRRKYLKYYILEMFFGARKQVFLTFAPFVLILNYGASTALIAMLFGIYSTINIFLNPLMGRMVDKIGYKKILIVDAFLLIIICIVYGFSHHLFSKNTAFIIVSIIFVLDGMLFVVGMARSIYVKSISSEKSELTATLSTGISINHLISIIIALLGGLLWEQLGIEILFLFAACFGLGAFVFSFTLPESEKLLNN